MATTVQAVWDRATTMSFMNDESLINPTQVMAYIGLYERNIFLRAARLNPEYFGTTGLTATRGSNTASWSLDALTPVPAAITRVEVAAFIGTPYANAAAGDRVGLASIRWPDLEISPRALLRGRSIIGYKTELGPDISDYVTQLNVFYSPLPAPITSLTQNLTAPDEWADLITYPLARILAIRDRRTDEETNWLTMDFERLQTLFDEAVLVYDYGVRRPAIPLVPPIPIGPVGGQAAPRGGGGGGTPPPGRP
jgi:hypothetical protein